MALILTFPPESRLTTSDLVAMISAVLDEPATKSIGPLGSWIWKWRTDEFLIESPQLGRYLNLSWGKLSEIYEPALSWGARESTGG